MGEVHLRKYGVGAGANVYMTHIKRGVVDYAVSADWTPAAGDVVVSKDGGIAANIGTLPTAVTMGNTAMWKYVFTNAELQCACLKVTISDSATKAVEDDDFTVETYGNASALHAFDLGTASTAQTGDAFARLGAPVGASIAADINALPTATANADALLKRDWTLVTGEAARSVLNALRFLRNKWSIGGTTLTVTKEDDTTSAWTSALTADAAANPVVASDPV